MLYTYIAAALIAAAALSGFGTWKVQDWRYAEKENERLEQEAEAKKIREKAISAASDTQEKTREKERVVYRTITKTVDRIIERPVYSNVCLDDDGILAINRGKVE